MNMYKDFMYYLPPTRAELVTDLYPYDVSLPPYVWTDPYPALSYRRDTFASGCCSLDEYDYDVRTLSTDSSIALSRALTDSEIDYERYRRIKNRSMIDPWYQVRTAHEAFPSEYLTSINSFKERYKRSLSDVYLDPVWDTPRPLRNYELTERMIRFFDEDCLVFAPDDPGLTYLEDALENIDLKALERIDSYLIP